MKKAIVLLSGGMDSAVTTAIALKENDQVCALHLNYGQRTQERELKSFLDLCDFYNITEKLIVDISYLINIGGSSLTDQSMDIENADLNNKSVPNSYVPFRNANILTIATSWAEVIEANNIYIGAVQEDGTGYPDTRVEFFEAFEKVANFGTKPETLIQIKTPIINLTKSEIIIKAKELNVPLELTYSCYKSNEIACGECDSCAYRLRGFRLAGFEDPIQYLNRPIY